MVGTASALDKALLKITGAAECLKHLGLTREYRDFP